jgi:hypothetical protein
MVRPARTISSSEVRGGVGTAGSWCGDFLQQGY